MVLTTAAVVGLPLLAVTMLRSQGVVVAQIPLLLIALVVSFAVSAIGAAIWKTRPGSGDLLFGDLPIWGFLRRWRVDRRLSSAAALLGLREGEEDAGQTPAQKAQLLEKLSAALEARDPYTHGHSRRVARHSTLIAKRMGLSAEEVARIRMAAAIHDVGKVETPREVLSKTGRLNDEEFELIKRHPVDGARMVAALDDEELTRIVRHHHERLDGKGYPDGLSGAEIPLGARIIAVADTFDAITSTRPYRAATSHKRALEVLRKESGTQLDPKAVEAFRSYYSGLRPVAVWAVLVSLPQRLFSWLFDGVGAAVAGASKVTATAAIVAGTAALSAGSLVHPPPPSEAARHPVTAAADATAGAQPETALGPHSQDQASTGSEHAKNPPAQQHPHRHNGPGSTTTPSHSAPGSGPNTGTSAGATGGGDSSSGSPIPPTAGGGTGGGASGGGTYGDSGGSPSSGAPSAGSDAGTPTPGSSDSSRLPEQAAAPEHASPPPSAGPPEQAAAPEHASPPPSAGPPEQGAVPDNPGSPGKAPAGAAGAASP